MLLSNNSISKFAKHDECLIISSDMSSVTHKQPGTDQGHPAQNAKEHLSIVFIGHVGQFNQFVCFLQVINNV